MYVVLYQHRGLEMAWKKGDETGKEVQGGGENGQRVFLGRVGGKQEAGLGPADMSDPNQFPQMAHSNL